MVTTQKRLELLGKTSDQVANTLLELGFLGYERSIRLCPIILFVNSDPIIKEWGGMKAPHPGVITWDDCQILDPIIPQPVIEFMHRFDRGEYPELCVE